MGVAANWSETEIIKNVLYYLLEGKEAMAFMFFFFGKPVASLVMQLQDEGFEAVEHVYTTTQYGAQHGVLIGIQSLDPARLKPGNLGIFIPVWELNQNISLVLKRRFHDIVERRQPNWTPFFSQSYAA